jgi:hypothetical protein
MLTTIYYIDLVPYKISAPPSDVLGPSKKPKLIKHSGVNNTHQSRAVSNHQHKPKREKNKKTEHIRNFASFGDFRRLEGAPKRSTEFLAYLTAKQLGSETSRTVHLHNLILQPTIH